MKEGWQTKKLGEICDIERGGSPRPIQNFITTDSNGINWVKIGDATASGKYIYKTEEKIRPEGAKRSRMVYEGDFVLSNSMSFGRPYIMKTTGCIHDGWLVLHQPKVDPDYLYYVLSSDLVFDQFDRLAAGSTVRNLNIGLAKSVEIPYPPLPEQQRIVGILDEAFDGIATAKANAEKNLKNARALFESHLQFVFTQRGEGWVDTPLGDVCGFVRGPFGGSLKKSIFVADGYAVYEQQHAIYDQFDDVRYFIDEAKFNEMKRFELLPNDLIMSCSGTMGRVAIVPNGIKRGIINQALLKLTPTAKIANAFLKLWMESEAFQDALKEYSGGAAIQNVASVKILKEIRIALPSVDKQEHVVAELETLREETQHLESVYQQKLAALDDLKKSLLHQAFTGAL